LPNRDGKLLPGMYAYVKVMIEHPGVRALPPDALVYSGDRTWCWLYKKGHAVRTEVQTGVSDGDWIEVTNRQLDAPGDGDLGWPRVDGSERVILGDFPLLAGGTPVRIAQPTATVAAATDR